MAHVHTQCEHKTTTTFRFFGLNQNGPWENSVFLLPTSFFVILRTGQFCQPTFKLRFFIYIPVSTWNEGWTGGYRCSQNFVICIWRRILEEIELSFAVQFFLLEILNMEWNVFIGNNKQASQFQSHWLAVIFISKVQSTLNEFCLSQIFTNCP